jgi:hypothetical protein
MNIWPAQLQALQTLFGLYARHCLVESNRSKRLEWASQAIGRPLASFNDLRRDEAARLIDSLKEALGQPSKAWRRPRDPESARAAGRHGRKGVLVEVPMLAAPEDIERVHALRESCGMSLEGFEEWLRSRSSPLGRFGDATLRTVADCNKVLWALKALLRRAG